MLKRINQCDIFVGLWCIYMLQGILYPRGIFNQLLQLIMLLWSMLAVVRYIIHSTEYLHSSILKAAFLLIVMYTIYGGIHIMFGEAIKMRDQYLYLQTSLNSLAPIFLFYTFTADGKLTSDRFRIYLPVLIVTCVLLYYENERQFSLLTNQEEVTNNIAYMFISLIPFLFFYSKKPFLQYTFMGIILLYVFMGMKRGAILIGVLGTMVLLYTNLKNSSRGMKFLFAILTIIIVVGVSKYIDYMMNNSAYFMARIEQTMDGDSSGRDIIYGNLWNTILTEQSPFYFYLGRGADSTLKIAGNYAHQDWLETFCNNGLIGVLILSYFFFAFGRNVLKSRFVFPGMMFYSFATLWIIIFSKTLFSMSIQDLKLFESMLIGYFASESSNLEQSDITNEAYD